MGDGVGAGDEGVWTARTEDVGVESMIDNECDGDGRDKLAGGD